MITEWLMTPGDWQLRLRDDCPQDVLNLIDTWDHVIVTDGWVDPARFSDTQLKAMARWAGVVLELPRHGDGRDFAGLGLALHLGDTDGVGDIYESAVSNTTETFPNWIRDLLPAGGAITEGTLYSASGTLTASIQWVTPRQAIDWICGQFSPPAGTEDCEWRVNPAGTLDAGPQSDMWITDPASETLPPLLVARDAGTQPNAHAVPVVELAGQNEAYLRIMKQWVHGRGEGDALITGSATQSSHGLKDYHGNTLVRTRVTPDSLSDVTAVTQRANVLLRQSNATHKRWEADLGDFWVQGQFRPGDWVLLYDPEAGFTDAACEMDWRGDRIWPDAVRVVGWTWAVSEGMGVYLRHRDGTWTDLTPYLQLEQPSTKLMLGDRPVETVDLDLTGEYLAFRYTSDTATPNVPTSLAATADTYIGPRGREIAWIIPTWTNPTLNTDGSTLTDLDLIQIRWRRNSTAEEWEHRYLDSDDSGVRALRRVDPDTVYELQARARRRNGRKSAWTASATVDTSHDTVVPGKPPTPSLDVSNPSGVLVSIDLTTWGPANPDATFFPVWGHTANNFAAATRLGRIPVTFAELAAEDTISRRFALPSTVLGATYYVWVKARDDGGNLSVVSDVASATPAQIATAFIEDAAVTGPKLGDGDVVALLTLDDTGLIRTAASGQRVEISAAGYDRISFPSGSASEDSAAFIYSIPSDPNTAKPVLSLVGPDVDGDFTVLELHSTRFKVQVAGATVIDSADISNGAWTPTFSALTTDPTGALNTSGSYVRNGHQCSAWAIITADSGFTAGSGSYYFSLPVTASSNLTTASGSATGSNVGTCRLYDATDGSVYVGTLHLRSTSAFFVAFHGTAARHSPSVPITPAAGDKWMFNLNYEVD